MSIRIKKGKTKLPPSFVPPLDPCSLPLARCPVPRERASRRILIMRAGSYGDILMGTPLLAALRDAYPEAHLTWLVEYSERGAIEANPYVDEILLWDSGYFRRLFKPLRMPLWALHALGFRAALRRRRYDVFVSFQPEEWPLLLHGTGAKTTVGVFDTFRRHYRATETSGHTRRYTHAYAEPDLPAHRIDQYLLTLKALGLPSPENPRMSMGYTAEDAEFVRQWLDGQGVTPSERLVVLVPMTTWPTKCWPGERYAALADALAGRHGCRVALIGSAGERAEIEKIAGAMHQQPLVAAGAFSFRQMAALLAGAALVVTGDTGPMHVADAVGTPQVALFGPTSPAWYGPRGGHAVTLLHPVPCGPCDQKFCPNTGESHEVCMRLLTVAEVLEAAAGLLGAEEALPA